MHPKTTLITRIILTGLNALLLLLTGHDISLAASAQSPVVCRLAYSAKVHYAPQILASRKGWFAAEGVRVQDVKLGMTAGIGGAEALISGSADVAVMGDVPGIIALAGKRNCILVTSYGGGERMHAIVVGGASGITKPVDLVGKRLGVQFGSSTHGAVMLYLKRHKIDPARVKLMNIPQKDLIDALQSGSIDALAASDPTPSQAQARAKGTRELACLSGLGNDYPLVIVASRAFADAHPEAIRAIVAGTRRAVQWIKTNPKAAAQELAPITGAPVELELASLRKLEWWIRLDEGIIRSLSTTAAFLHSTGKLKQVPDIKALARPEFMKP